MRFVPIKTIDQEAGGIILKHREMLVGQRTQAINGLRGHASEFGIIAAKGTVQVAALLTELAADIIPATARAVFERMGAYIDVLDQQIEAVDGELAELHKTNSVSQLLAAISGVGPLGAITMVLTVQPEHFKSGRHFAAWLGLTPQERSTGGKQRLGKISKAGNERLRQLAVRRRHLRHPLRQARQPIRLGVAIAIAGE